MALEDFKKTADLRQKIFRLDSDLTRLTTKRTANMIQDFEAKAVAFFEDNGFQVTISNQCLRANYSGCSIKIDLPNATARALGATVQVSVSVDLAFRWNLTLTHKRTLEPNQRTNVKDPSEIEKLEQQASELETLVSAYENQSEYIINYSLEHPQSNPLNDQKSVATSVEQALTAIIERKQ